MPKHNNNMNTDILIPRSIECSHKQFVDLSTNINPNGVSDIVVKSLIKKLQFSNIYPDDSQILLRKKISGLFNLDVTNVSLGSGSSEIFINIFKSLIKQYDSVIIPEKSFLLYKSQVKWFCSEIIESSLTDDFKISTNSILEKLTINTKMIILSIPNNPTGQSINYTELYGFLEKVPPNIYICIDAAYSEYMSESLNSNFGKLINNFNHLIVIKTFSKIFGLAGLRIGYLISNKRIVDEIENSRLPYNTNCLSQSAALTIFEDHKFISNSIKVNNEGKNYLYSEFNKMDIKYFESETNFVLCNLGPKSQLVIQKLKNRNILIRSLDDFGFESGYVRISVGKKKENQIFVRELKEILKQI